MMSLHACTGLLQEPGRAIIRGNPCTNNIIIIFTREDTGTGSNPIEQV